MDRRTRGMSLEATGLRRTRLLLFPVLALSVILGGCTLGEAVLPNPTAVGQVADQQVGPVGPVPNPIPHSLEGRKDCFTCHAIGAVDAPAVPADHEEDVRQCVYCHAVWTQPGLASASPPAIGHDLEGREDCLTCHKIGTAGAPRVPDNHLGLPSSICRACHLAGEDVPGGSTEAVGSALPIPHGLDGFATCTACHEEGGSGVPQFPPDHAGRSDSVCTACHSPSVAAATAIPLATGPAEPDATPTGGATVPAVPAAAPVIPHAVEELSSCSLCHEKGSATAPAFPADHAGRADTTCTACHLAAPQKATPVPAVSPTEAPAALPSSDGAALYAANCAVCHGDQGQGSAVVEEPLNSSEVLREEDSELRAVIEGGEGAMPGFAGRLTTDEIAALLEFMRDWQKESATGTRECMVHLSGRCLTSRRVTGA